MKKNIFKKGCVLFTIICMFTLQLQAVAAMVNIPKVDDTMSDKQALEELGITGFANIVEDKKVTVGDELKTQFTVKSGDIINDITVLENSDEKISLQIEQEDICNVLEVYDDGKIVLDGYPVIIERENDAAVMSNSEPVVRRAGATIYWKDKVDYGTASDYSHFLKNENIADIELNKTISKIGLSALLSIMGIAMGGGVAGGLFASGAGNEIYNYFLSKDPNTTALSCKSKVYTHKNYTSGYIPSIFTFIYKYKTTFYSKANYGGSSTAKTVYKYNMQG